MKKYEKIYNKVTIDNAKSFNKFAEWIVDNQCSDLNGDKIVNEARKDLIEAMSADLKIGSLYTRNKYITIGIACGIAITSFVFILKDKIKEKSRK